MKPAGPVCQAIYIGQVEEEVCRALEDWALEDEMWNLRKTVLIIKQ